MEAQRRTALFFVTQGVGCASDMCDWGISGAHMNMLLFHVRDYVQHVTYTWLFSPSGKNRVSFFYSHQTMLN